MIISMTGYASHERNTKNGVLQVELRSVNQRYLELQLKLEDTFRAQEPQVRELLKQKLGRGKVECRINLAQANTAETIELNHSVLQNIAASVKAASDYFPATQAVNVLDVLRMPGVMVVPVFDAEALTQDVMTALDVALETLISARAREGEKLKAMILARLAEIESLIFTVKPMLPTMVKAHQDKLLAKLQEAQLSHDEERIRQEIVLYTQRIDVDEELSRLDSHVHEVKRLLTAGGMVGKQLDFLMQEMNREANTLGSKSVAIETTQIAMQLKVLIEQMREQIQNIE
ncbi:MAG: YicC family protein [Betaproteobacteria bacterium]|nr:YicC family protein [Betaproteobacteria bacterium]MCH9848325.1 YicC family protein [Betaproteobacteria bacterium]